MRPQLTETPSNETNTQQEKRRGRTKRGNRAGGQAAFKAGVAKLRDLEQQENSTNEACAAQFATVVSRVLTDAKAQRALKKSLNYAGSKMQTSSYLLTVCMVAAQLAIEKQENPLEPACKAMSLFSPNEADGIRQLAEQIAPHCTDQDKRTLFATAQMEIEKRTRAPQM